MYDQTHPVETILNLERLDLANAFLDPLRPEPELFEDPEQGGDFGDDLVLRFVDRLGHLVDGLAHGQFEHAALLPGTTSGQRSELFSRDTQFPTNSRRRVRAKRKREESWTCGARTRRPVNGERFFKSAKGQGCVPPRKKDISRVKKKEERSHLDDPRDLLVAAGFDLFRELLQFFALESFRAVVPVATLAIRRTGSRRARPVRRVCRRRLVARAVRAAHSARGPFSASRSSGRVIPTAAAIDGGLVRGGVDSFRDRDGGEPARAAEVLLLLGGRRLFGRHLVGGLGAFRSISRERTVVRRSVICDP